MRDASPAGVVRLGREDAHSSAMRDGRSGRGVEPSWLEGGNSRHRSRADRNRSTETYLAFFSGPHRQPLSENIQSRARLARVPYGGCRATWIDEIRPCWNTGLSFEKVRKPSSRGSAPCRSRRRRRKGGRVVPPAGSPR